MKRKLLFILLVTCILFSVSGVFASDINETAIANDESDMNNLEAISNDENQPLGDVKDLVGDADNGTFTTLQLKISLAKDGSEINLTRDYKYNDDFKLTTGVFINKDITINGNGHVIDAMGKSALTLKNSKFNKNSAGGDAGAVFSLTLKKGPQFYYNYFEGKNATDDVNLLLGIAMQAVLEHGKDTITNCVFTNNIANGRGGGAVYAYSHIDINSCTFNSNKAGEKGGAVFGCKDLFIKNSKFNKNQVSMYGGAVYFKCHEQTGHYENGAWVSSVKYYTNSIEGSTFANNVAGERGGAIYGFRTSDSDKVHCAKAVKCTFSDNKAPKGKDIYGGTVKNCVYKNTKIALKTATVKKSAKKLTLQATLKKGSSPLKGKQVTFKFNGKTYKAKTNSKGIAKVTIKQSILNKLKVGKTIKYQAKYGSFIAKKTAKVKK